jgi:SOUL heme-binding protein
MKSMWIVLIVLTVVFIAFQSFMSISNSNIEKQQYRVVKAEKGFELRYYPPATFATVKSSAKSYRELSGSGFRKIAGYIFGDNESSTKIAMTSPVHMDINEKESSMSFVMPSNYDVKSLPKPNDAKVEIHQTPGEYAAAIEFGGFANDASIRKHAEELKQLLDQKGIKTIGNFRYLGYNPPYQIIARKNEIVVAVEWNENKK